MTPLLSSGKVSSWDTKLIVLGWEIDTVAMTTSLPADKPEQLNHFLAEWPERRAATPESEVRCLIGNLLHVCAVVRPGNYFVRRMLHAVGLPQQNRGR